MKPDRKNWLQISWVFILMFALPASGAYALDCPEGEIAAEIALLYPGEKENQASVFNDVYIFSELALTNPLEYNGQALVSIGPNHITPGVALSGHIPTIGKIHALVCVNENADTLFAWGLYGKNGAAPTLRDTDYFDQYAGILTRNSDDTATILLHPIELDCTREGGLFDILEMRFPGLSRDDIDVQAVCVASGREYMRDQPLLTPNLLTPNRGYVEEGNNIWVTNNYSETVIVSRLVKSVLARNGELLTADNALRPFKNLSFRLLSTDKQISLCFSADGHNCFTYNVERINADIFISLPSSCEAGEQVEIEVGFNDSLNGAGWLRPVTLTRAGQPILYRDDSGTFEITCPVSGSLNVEVLAELVRTQGFGIYPVTVLNAKKTRDIEVLVP